MHAKRHLTSDIFHKTIKILWLMKKWEITFLILKPTRRSNFSNLFWKWNSTCFGQFLCPSSGLFLYTQQWYVSYRFVDSFRAAGSGCSILILLDSCLQTCMTYTNAECAMNNSWWWTEELSETCAVSFQNKIEKLLRLVGFITKKWSRCTVTWTSRCTVTWTSRCTVTWT
jgi:hypothetical protein